MRLTKTLYFLDKVQSETPTGVDQFGREEYGFITDRIPFLGEVEPFSNRLAETNYGLFVECTHRIFCEPHSLIRLKALIEYNGEEFEVNECLSYGRHLEVLIKRVKTS
jgi:hypothetical protein